MTTNAKDRQAFQLWIETTQEAVDKAKKIANDKRMTFRGYLGTVIENAIEAEEVTQ